MFGALVGASAAFTLAGLREWRKERNARMEQFKTALFILALQRGFIRGLYYQYLKAARNDADRAYSVTHVVVAPTLGALDIKGLAFILTIRKGEIIQDLMAAEEAYRNVLALLEVRNATHIKFQEKLEVSKASEGTLDDLERIAGKVTANHLRDYTNSLYQAVEDANNLNLNALQSAQVIHAALRREERAHHQGLAG